ncbi:nucleotide exchange factor GrpE [Candidatus Roizmanbacteria bacterium]|nr:nucleotide exchange factor GrpE [Candidatus Roizmanbacteria bacterium]
MDDKKIDKKEEDKKHITGKLKELEKQVEEYKNKYLRVLADHQNFERRVRQEQEENAQSTQARLVLKLLPFLDNLEKAEVFVKDSGLHLIKNNFYQILKEMGLEEIEVLEKEFDPGVAEAVDVVSGERDNIVVDVVKKGYKYNMKLLRPAQVKVEKKAGS